MKKKNIRKMLDSLILFACLCAHYILFIHEFLKRFKKNRDISDSVRSSDGFIVGTSGETNDSRNAEIQIDVQW